MKPRYFILIFVILLMTSNFFFCFFYFKEKQSNVDNTKLCRKNKKQFHELKNKYYVELKDGWSFVRRDMKILNIQEDSLKLSDIILDNPKLVLTFSRYACSACIKKEIKILSNFKSKFDTNEVIILTDFENARELIIFVKMNEINYSMYIIDELFGIKADEERLPYYFVLDKDMCMKDLFIAPQYNSQMTFNYLQTISGKYFTKN